MWETVKRNVVRPMAERLGTMAGMALVPFGVHAETAEMVTIGIISIGFVACDLVADWLKRRQP